MLVGVNVDEVCGRLDKRRKSLEWKGLKISKDKTEYIDYNFGEGKQRKKRNREVKELYSNLVDEVIRFKYFWICSKKNGSFDKDM